MAEKRLNYGILHPSARNNPEKKDKQPWGSLIGFLSVVMLVVAWGVPTVCQGAGFALVQQGTAAMAQGNAFVAEANDASAIFYNPAGLNQLKRPQLYLGSFFFFPDQEYRGWGGDSKTRPRLHNAGSFFLAVPVHDRVALGLGYFSPFGLSTDWPADWAGRYITTYSRLKTYNVNPVISLKLMDNLSIAGGVNFLWSDVRLRRRIPLITRPLVDGKSDIKGSGTGIGANFGLLYEPLQGIKLGVSYRSPIYVDHNGRLELSLPTIVRGVPRSVDGSAKLIFPPSVTFGVSVNRFQPFTFNVDATWTGWSTYENLEVKLNRAILVNGRPATSIVTEKNWHDAWALRFGANWQVKDNMKIRAGYTFDMTPVPNSTIEPQVPDANRHIFAVGGDLKVWRLNLGFAYNFILNEARNKDNLIAFNGVPLPDFAQVNGKYQSHTHTLGLSAAYEF